MEWNQFGLGWARIEWFGLGDGGFAIENGEGQVAIDKPKFKNGVYFYQYIVNGEMRESGRFVIAK